MMVESTVGASDGDLSPEGEQDALLGMSIVALVGSSNVSARLHQAIDGAMSHDALPFSTVAEYIAAGKNAVTVLIACKPHFDRKSAIELDSAMQGILRKVKVRRDLHRKQLATLLSDMPIGSLLAGAELPVRLVRVLASPRYETLSFRTYVLDRIEIERSIAGGGNCGRRSLDALRGLALVVADEQLRRIGLEGAKRSSALSTLFEGASSYDTVLRDTAAGSTVMTVPDGPPGDCGATKFADWLLGSLPSRAAEVLTRRFGIGGCAMETLAEIGQDLRVTRERVRQIEAKALRKLGELCRVHPPAALLSEAAGVGWRDLAGDRQYLTDAEAHAALRKLDGNLLLILEAVGVPKADWLARIAAPIGRGWTQPDRATAQIHAFAEAWASDGHPRLLPRALGDCVGGISQDDAEVALVLLLGLHVEAGYVFAKRPLARLRRATALHALLVNRGHPTGLFELHREYVIAVPEDPCSYRDALIVMEMATHFFVEISDDVWVGLGIGGSLPVSPRAFADYPRQPDEGDTIIGALERELARSGPTRLGVLLERSFDVLPAGRSANSIGPILITNRGRFARPLPGVYALPGQVLTPAETVRSDDIDYLLEPQQARLYALGRRAGEAWGSFPLWTAAAEYRLCRWAQEKGRPELFRSLLAIASPDAWPVDDAEKTAWRELAMRQGRFELAFANRVSIPVLAPLDRVLAACLHLRDAGHIGWMSCNRILGLRLDSQTSTSLLAVLVGSGIVEEPIGSVAWQRPHRAGPALLDWTERLSGELASDGRLDWSGPVGRALAAKVGRSVDAGTAPEDAAVAFAEDLDEFEQLVAEHRRAVRSKRREEALEWLGVE